MKFLKYLMLNLLYQIKLIEVEINQIQKKIKDFKMKDSRTIFNQKLNEEGNIINVR